MEPKRVVVLTGTGSEHKYVASRLVKSTSNVIAVIHVSSPPASFGRRLRRALQRYGLKATMQRVIVAAVLRASGQKRRRAETLNSMLPVDTPDYDIREHLVAGVNSKQTISLLKALRPDILCIYGTTVVGPETLACARDLALNLHTGISPRYRGADCAFWALYQAEPDWVGATVHECTMAIDGGAVFGTARAVLFHTDGVAAVFARAVVVGADLYARCLEEICAGTAEAIPQDLTLGREYLSRMRDLRAEWRVHRLLSAGLIQNNDSTT